jgi:hypothetical protein
MDMSSRPLYPQFRNQPNPEIWALHDAPDAFQVTHLRDARARARWLRQRYRLARALNLQFMRLNVNRDWQALFHQLSM